MNNIQNINHVINNMDKIKPDNVFSEKILFVCTYAAKLNNIRIPFESLTQFLCNNLSGNILAINSNFGHASQAGYEYLIKSPKTVLNKNSMHVKSRIRKIQGDGTCFNSAIEPVIKIPSSKPDKIYFIKCFPTTGETQIPGVICDDFSDGNEVLEIFISYLNSLKLGTDNNLITLDRCGPKMLNYKFKLNRSSPRILINLINLSKYLQSINNTLEIIQYEDWHMITPPYIIKEIKSSVDDIKTSFRIQTSEKRSPRVNIFQEGKINILGAETVESSELIYKFLIELFNHNWIKLINIRPEKDKY
jgi:hypothetical protein